MRTTRALTGVLFLFLLGGCDSSSAPVPPDLGGDDLPPIDGPCLPQLSAIGPTTQSIEAGKTAELQVRLTSCAGEPLAGSGVSFKVVGDPKGSFLGNLNVSTDSGGVAKVQVSAGTQAASFQVEASYPSATAVTFNVTVSLKPLGTIVVQMAYGGTRTFGEFQAILYPGKTCLGMDPFSPPTGLDQATVTALTDKPQFQNRDEGDYTVVVLAKNGTDVAGWGCVEVVVKGGQTTTALVNIQDLPVIYDGTYILDNQFDLTGALPPSVASTVQIIHELDDDHDLTNEMNSHGNDQYGLDPAAFLLDFVFRQICRWECQSTEDFDTCSELNHGKGDIRALYLHNLMSWSPAKPYFMGLCTALDFPLTSGYVYTYVNDEVQKMIAGVVPTIAQNGLQIASDISGAFTNLKIKSTLTLAKVHRAAGNFTHVLDTMTLSVHDLQGQLLSKEVKLADAGLTNLSYSGSAVTKDDRLQIPKHSFQLSFGKLLQYIYLNVLLPALGYTSTAQMFGTWVNCTSVGNWLYTQIGNALGISPLPAATYKAFCDLGLVAAGKWVEDSIQKSVSTTAKLEIQGTCEAGTPLGPKRLANSLVQGLWTGTLTEGTTFSKPIKGTFTGKRP